ncbi:tautomerase family protein [Mesorhizobium sp. ORM8.1]
MPVPIVKIDLHPGRSPRQKLEVADAITRVFMEKLGSDPKDVMVIFNDTPAQDWFAAGQPMQSPVKS